MRLPLRLGGGVVLAVAVLAALPVLRQREPDVVLRSVTVGKMPGWVAVDERTNRAFVANSADHSVSVLDARSGTVLRTIVVGAEPDALVPDIRAGRILVLSDLVHGASVLDAGSGTALRTLSGNTWQLLVDERTDHVFAWGVSANLNTPTMSMLDGRSGALLHTDTRVGATAWGGAVDSDTHRAFITDVDADTVGLVDTSSGRILRLVAVGQRPVSVAVDRASHHAFVANNGDDTLTMLDSRSGQVLRTIKVGQNPARIVVDERTARVFVVHGRGGPGNNPFSNLTPFAGISTTGTTILDARSGALLGRLAVGGSPLDDVGFENAMNLVVDERHGRVFVINVAPSASTDGSANGSVSVLDGRTGRLLRTVPVGRHPIALAVDETTARLFVVNTNSGCIGEDPWRWIPTPIRRWLPLISQPPAPRCGMHGTVAVIDTSRL